MRHRGVHPRRQNRLHLVRRLGHRGAAHLVHGLFEALGEVAGVPLPRVRC